MLIALGAGLALLSLLGPVGIEKIDYRIADQIVRSQLLGLDAVSLLIVAPLAVAAGVLALRGHPAWALLALGPALYAAYMVPQYVLGPDYLEREGNNERFFLLLLVLFVLALTAAVAAWGALSLDRLRTSARIERLVATVLLPVAALIAFGRYVPLLADTMSASPTTREYLVGPDFVWTIALLDLGVALPATVAALIGFHIGAPWARKALYAVVAWFALVGIAVAAMSVVMYLRDDPGASLGAAVAMTALGAAFAAIAVLLAAPIASRRAAAAAGMRA